MRYGFPRIQWLAGIISAISLIFVTSGLWQQLDSKNFPNINPNGFVIFSLVFACLLLLGNIYDVSKLTENKWKIIVIATLSSLIDLLTVCSVEYLSLVALGAFPQDYIKGTYILLIGALPASMGSNVLSSLTSKSLKDRSKKLHEELKTLHTTLDELQVKREKAVEEIKAIQEQTTESLREIEKGNTRAKRKGKR